MADSCERDETKQRRKMFTQRIIWSESTVIYMADSVDMYMIVEKIRWTSQTSDYVGNQDVIRALTTDSNAE